jgi:FkbM family methyltransferase
MAKTNKLSNLKRLNLKNKFNVISYLFKKILKINPTEKEINVYEYYNFLINSNGYFLNEKKDFILSEFKNSSIKTIKLRKRPSSDFDVFQQIFGWFQYQKVVDEYKKNFINNVNHKINIIDAGSNIGLSSLFFSDNFHEPNIVCVEPEEENFKVLEFNLKKQKNIYKIKGGLWSSNTYLKVVRDFRDKNHWSFRVEETNDSRAIKAYSINQLVKDYNFEFIDILKIDIEGSEKEIFTTENVDLSFLTITKCIALEIHDEFKCREDINMILFDFGFIFFTYGELTIGVNQNLTREAR